MLPLSDSLTNSEKMSKNEVSLEALQNMYLII